MHREWYIKTTNEEGLHRNDSVDTKGTKTTICVFEVQ